MAKSEHAHIYWDTTCFICFLNKAEKQRRDICEDILHRAKDGDVVIYTSTLSIAEVVRPKVVPAGKPLTAEQVTKITDMFKWRWLRKIDVDQRVAFKAVELSRDYGLKPADAIHAASAILQKVQVLQHWDRDYAKIAHLIKVEEPKSTRKQGLLSSDWRKNIGPAPE